MESENDQSLKEVVDVYSLIGHFNTLTIEKVLAGYALLCMLLLGWYMFYSFASSLIDLIMMARYNNVIINILV